MHTLGVAVVASCPVTRRHPIPEGLHDERQGGGRGVCVVVVSLSGARMYSLGVAVVASFLEWKGDVVTRCGR